MLIKRCCKKVKTKFDKYTYKHSRGPWGPMGPQNLSKNCKKLYEKY